MVKVGTGTSGTRFIKRYYPNENTTQSNSVETIGDNVLVSLSTCPNTDSVSKPVDIGIKITTKTKCRLLQVTTATDNTVPVNVILKDVNGATLDTAAISSGVATFSYDLDADTVYRIEGDVNGAGASNFSCHNNYFSSGSVNKQNFVVEQTSINGADSANPKLYLIETVTTINTETFVDFAKYEGTKPYLDYTQSFISQNDKVGI